MKIRYYSLKSILLLMLPVEQAHKTLDERVYMSNKEKATHISPILVLPNQPIRMKLIKATTDAVYFLPKIWAPSRRRRSSFFRVLTKSG